jgi:hypothetical protein
MTVERRLGSSISSPLLKRRLCEVALATGGAVETVETAACACEDVWD